VGKVFLGGQCLKKDEFSHSGKEIKTFQVVPGKLASQNSRLLHEGKMLVDNDQISARQSAPSAVNGDLFIRKAFIANSNFQQRGKVFQMLEEGSFGEIVTHSRLAIVRVEALYTKCRCCVSIIHRIVESFPVQPGPKRQVVRLAKKGASPV
jgi:hypothetical protein